MSDPNILEQTGRAARGCAPVTGSASADDGLLPCPLCQGRAEFYGGCVFGGLLNNLGIRCSVCGMETRSGQFKKYTHLRDFWNGKTPNDKS